jgi:Ca2+-binding EF-hand superfamily protein
MGCGGSKTSNPSHASLDSQAPTCVVIRDSTEGEKRDGLAAQENLVKLAVAKTGGSITDLLDNVFNHLDKNGDGFVSKDELSTRLHEVLDYSELDSEKSIRTLIAESGWNPYFHLFDKLDTNQDGKISREEFQANLHPAKAAVHAEEHLKAVFQGLDANGDGFVSREELTSSLGQLMDSSCIVTEKSMRTLLVDAGLDPDFNVFDQLDANHDGKITWEEFSSKMKQVNTDEVKRFLRSVFFSMDVNEDGSVSQEELSKSIEHVLECSHLKSKKTVRTLITDAGMNPDFYLFEQLDTNKDGKITWEELEANLFSEPFKVVDKKAFVETPLPQEVKQEIEDVTHEVECEEREVASSTYCSLFC